MLIIRLDKLTKQIFNGNLNDNLNSPNRYIETDILICKATLSRSCTFYATS